MVRFVGNQQRTASFAVLQEEPPNAEELISDMPPGLARGVLLCHQTTGHSEKEIRPLCMSSRGFSHDNTSRQKSCLNSREVLLFSVCGLFAHADARHKTQSARPLSRSGLASLRQRQKPDALCAAGQTAVKRNPSAQKLSSQRIGFLRRNLTVAGDDL